MAKNSMKSFPIHSQTSDADKTVLLKIKELLQEHGQYNYAEIGSYLGGSLTPFLADNDCVSILSIDERERQQPDERGAKYDYSGITHDTMLNNLRNHGFDTTKIEVFDGSVNEYTPNKTYDFIFIDGEHTDWACFRDFIHAERLCKQDCIVAFHDTSLVYKAIKIINELLIASGVKFKLVKVKDSEMTCIFFNKFADTDLFVAEDDMEAYYLECEEKLLLELLKHRVSVQQNNQGSITFTINKPPVFGQG